MRMARNIPTTNASIIRQTKSNVLHSIELVLHVAPFEIIRWLSELLR